MKKVTARLDGNLRKKALPVRTAPGRQKTKQMTLPLLQYGNRQERAAGWQIVKEALAGGWRSVGPYGPRADLYDRP